MDSRNVVIVGIVGLALVVILVAVNSITAASGKGAEATARQVSVAGYGEVKGTPDTAQVQLGVETSHRTAKEAMEENSVQSNQIISKLLELGIDRKDIQTANFSIYPVYDEQGRVITGYQVNNTVSVTIRNLDKAGKLLEQVVQVGANRIHGISFSVGDPSELMRKARAKAMEDALAKARQLASASNATLGEVLFINDSGASMPPPVFKDAVLGLGGGEAAAQDAPPPVYGGEQSFTAYVHVTYRLR